MEVQPWLFSDSVNQQNMVQGQSTASLNVPR